MTGYGLYAYHTRRWPAPRLLIDLPYFRRATVEEIFRLSIGDAGMTPGRLLRHAYLWEEAEQLAALCGQLYNRSDALWHPSGRRSEPRIRSHSRAPQKAPMRSHHRKRLHEDRLELFQHGHTVEEHASHHNNLKLAVLASVRLRRYQLRTDVKRQQNIPYGSNCLIGLPVLVS